MKRFFCIAMTLLLLLAGCASQGYRDPVTFYYPRSQYQYGGDQSVIAREDREASGHRWDLEYLMALYLMGPSEEELRSPLPRGTQMLRVERKGSAITLTLSEVPSSMTDAAFSLACACLTRTCMSLTKTDSVTVVSGNRSITMTTENLILVDSSLPTETEDKS